MTHLIFGLAFLMTASVFAIVGLIIFLRPEIYVDLCNRNLKFIGWSRLIPREVFVRLSQRISGLLMFLMCGFAIVYFTIKFLR